MNDHYYVLNKIKDFYLKKVVLRNDLNMLKWLYKTIDKENLKYLINIDKFELAIKYNKIKILQWLLECTYDSENINISCQTLLKYAIDNGNIDTIIWLNENTDADIEDVVMYNNNEYIYQYIYDKTKTATKPKIKNIYATDDEEQTFITEIYCYKLPAEIAGIADYMFENFEIIERYIDDDDNEDDEDDEDDEDYNKKLECFKKDANEGNLSKKTINDLIRDLTSYNECGAILNIEIWKGDAVSEPIYTKEQTISILRWSMNDIDQLEEHDKDKDKQEYFGYGMYKMGQYCIFACGISI